MNDEDLVARRKATLGPTYRNFYDKPLHLVRGAGTALPGDALNWAEAEPWIAFGPALLFIPLGLIAGLTIWRRYRPVAGS